MSPRAPLLLAFFAVAGSATGFAYVAVKIVPEARRLARLDRQQRIELQSLTRALAAAHDEETTQGSTVSEDSKRAEQNAKQLAARLALTEVLPPSTSEESRLQWAAEIANKTGWPRKRVESWMPTNDSSPEAASIQMVTVRDLALAASEAGVESLVFIVFHREPPDRSTEHFGEWLPTIPVRLEYKATAAAHGAFMDGLLSRRDRGPLYTIESMELSSESGSAKRSASRPVKPLSPSAPHLSVSVTLRRIVTSPR